MGVIYTNYYSLPTSLRGEGEKNGCHLYQLLFSSYIIERGGGKEWVSFIPTIFSSYIIGLNQIVPENIFSSIFC